MCDIYILSGQGQPTVDIVYLNASLCLCCNQAVITTVVVVEVESLTVWGKGDVDAPNASV